MDVVIAGIGQTDVGEHWHVSLRELAFYALEAAMQDAGGLRPQALFVANILAPSISGQAHLGALIVDFAGLRGIEAYTIEAAGASGGAALRAAFMAIKSGFVDVAMVVGVEKYTDKVSSEVEVALAATADGDYESIHGMTLTAQAALLMRRYAHEHNLPAGALAGFPVTAHAHGVNNPHAMFRKAIKPSLYSRVGMVSDPLNMFDAAPDADGAAAVILTRSELLPPPGKRLSVERACQQANVTIDQMDLFELYDVFSIYAALSLEAAGFADPGEGWLLAEDGELALTGSIPSMTMGGLKARGNPWGATGVYQIVESTLQLRNLAGGNQIPAAQRALVQSLGGPASSVVTHILEVVESQP